MKNKSNIIESFKDEKSRKFAFLCLYLIFLFLIIAMARSSSGKKYDPVVNDESAETENNEVEITAFEKLNKIHNYQFEYIVKKDELEQFISGTRYEDEILFTFKGINYYNKQNDFYLIENDTITLLDSLLEGMEDVTYLKTELIYELLKSAKPSLELEIGEITTREYYLNEIKLITYEENNFINQVEIDYKETKIVLKLTNIGKVSKFNTNFKLQEKSSDD